VLGTEGDGLSSAALAAADTVVTIPMHHGIDSLNVASATAVALYALRVRRPGVQ
jgi:tRNA G18 (ribose-2'-O)-methylase SpoU